MTAKSRPIVFIAIPALAIAALLGLQTTPHGADRDNDQPAKHNMAVGTMVHGMFRPDDIEWHDGPESLPRGAEYAILKGDPAQPGPFTMRIRFPADYEIPPHWHPSDEHITVISGEFHLGMGTTIDRDAAEAMPEDTFAFMSPGMRHFAYTEQETVIQLHGIGPWAIHYVDPADDPRISPGE